MASALDRLVALTPKTAEASTVPEPIGKPNGPGLWHVKGMQLPPYIQHVAHELMKKGHSESDAIHMARGIVGNWAAGHDGHGHKVHPDVQAAAAKNMAQWEAKRGRAHAEHGGKDKKAAATAGADQPLALAFIHAFQRVEHGKVEQVGGYENMRQAAQHVGEASPEMRLGMMHELANRVRGAHGPEAAGYVHNAADAFERGDRAAASEHLTHAYNTIASRVSSRGLRGDTEHKAAQGNLDEIRQHLQALKGEGVPKPKEPEPAPGSVEHSVKHGLTTSDQGTRQMLSKAGYSNDDIERTFQRRWADPEQRARAISMEKDSRMLDNDIARVKARNAARAPGGAAPAGHPHYDPALTALGRVLALASVAGYERVEHGKLEHVGSYESMRAFMAERGMTDSDMSEMRQHLMTEHGGVTPGAMEEHFTQHLGLSLDSHGRRQAAEMAGHLQTWAQGQHGPETKPGSVADAFVARARDRQLGTAHARAAARHAADHLPKFGTTEYAKAAEAWRHRHRIPAGAGPHPMGEEDADVVRERADFSSPLERIVALAAVPRGRTSGTPYPQSMLPPSATAPGARQLGYGRLRQEPSQTASASPPLPPGVSLPDPKALDGFASKVEQTAGGSDLLTGAAKHLRAAATALRHKEPLSALHVLRGAQAGIRSAHQQYVAKQLPVANVFSASLNPAERSSAQAEMAETISTRDEFLSLAKQVAQYIDQIRRAHYHGLFPPGYPSGWGTGGIVGGPNVSAG